MIKAWNSKVEASSAFYSLDSRGVDAIYKKIKESKICQSYTTIFKIQELTMNDKLNDVLYNDIKRIKRLLNELYGFVILEPIDGLDIFEQAVVPWIISQSLGEIVGQNFDDDKIYIVNDLGGKMEDGYRYSRTNQGGSIHTDGVNIKKPFDYFLLHIISEGLTGGESIIVNGVNVYEYLKKSIPDAINILTGEFLWEYKGVKKNKYYHEPVLKLVNNIPMWRYLRNYIEEASFKKNEPLSDEKIWAMDCLDSVLESSDFQLRYRLKKGQTIFINDRNIFHGRIPYVDAKSSKYFSDVNKYRDSSESLKRTGLRIWINSSY